MFCILIKFVSQGNDKKFRETKSMKKEISVIRIEKQILKEMLGIHFTHITDVASSTFGRCWTKRW